MAAPRLSRRMLPSRPLVQWTAAMRPRRPCRLLTGRLRTPRPSRSSGPLSRVPQAIASTQPSMTPARRADRAVRARVHRGARVVRHRRHGSVPRPRRRRPIRLDARLPPWPRARRTPVLLGPVWREHAAANETMIDSDDVFLLRPVRRGLASPPEGTGLHVTVSSPASPPDSAFAAFETEPAEHVPAATGPHGRPVFGVVQPGGHGLLVRALTDFAVTDPLKGVR